MAKGTYSIRSILELVDFYEEHYDMFEEVRLKMTFGDLTYPQMKFIDMGFFQLCYAQDGSS